MIALIFAVLLFAGCSDDDDRDLFVDSLQLQKQADKLTTALSLSGGELVSGPLPEPGGGPVLESIRSPLSLVADQKFALLLTGRPEARPAVAMLLAIQYATDHVRVPLEANDDAVWKITGVLGGVPRGNWSVNITLVDALGHVGEPLIAELKVGKRSLGNALTLAPHAGATRALAFGTGKAAGTLITGGHDHELVLWDIKAGRRIRRFQGHVDWILDAALFADGTRLVSGSMDHHVRIWDVEKGTLVLTIGDALGPTAAIAVSPDDSLIAVGSWDGWIRIYDRNGVPVHSIEVGLPVNDLVFGGKGKALIGGMGAVLGDGGLRAWSTATWDAWSDDDEEGPFAIDREVTAVAFDEESNRLAGAMGRETC